jgi:hypothetical protein
MTGPTTDPMGELGAAGQALWRYWQGLPRHDLVPSRNDFDPRAIARILPLVSITERLGPGQWRIRLVGTGIVQRAGVELTGMNFLDLIDPALREVEDQRLNLMLNHPCGSSALRGGLRASGLVVRDRTLALPMRDHDGNARLLVSISEDVDAAKLPLESRLTTFRILERRYIDIGAGVPGMPEELRGTA